MIVGTRADRAGASTFAHAWEVLRTSLRLGLTSFGGPIAHLGYFQRTYVRRKGWLTDEEYGGLVALCQILPGPTSSQVGFLIGLRRAGWLGAFAAWFGFTMPSAVLLYACAVFSANVRGPFADAGVHGLKLVAVAVVAQAVWSMARRLCRDRATASLALASAALLLVVGGALTQLLVLCMGALAGVLWCRADTSFHLGASALVRPVVAWAALGMFLTLLALQLLFGHAGQGLAAFAGIFYRAGALVFGGGHVVLPLLRDSLEPGGWISDDRFLAGYGLAQAVPGPLFTVAAYIGAANSYAQSSMLSALIALTSIFLPGLLIATAGIALWHRFAHDERVRAGLVGINAAVVGVLGAALYDPVWTTSVKTGVDAAVAVVGLVLLERWKISPIAVLALCVGTSEVMAVLGPAVR